MHVLVLLVAVGAVLLLPRELLAFVSTKIEQRSAHDHLAIFVYIFIESCIERNGRASYSQENLIKKRIKHVLFTKTIVAG